MGPRSRMGELERAVMDALWLLDDDAWATGREVHERLQDRGLAYTTVMTVLDRLARKGYVERARDGRALRYRAATSQADLAAAAMRDALDTMASDRGSALVSFVEEASVEDLAALRRALAHLE